MLCVNHTFSILQSNSPSLWHLWLDHISKNKINRLVKFGILTEIKEKDYPSFESCIYGNITKLLSPSKAQMCKKIFDLIHIDILVQ